MKGNRLSSCFLNTTVVSDHLLTHIDANSDTHVPNLLNLQLAFHIIFHLIGQGDRKLIVFLIASYLDTISSLQINQAHVCPLILEIFYVEYPAALNKYHQTEMSDLSVQTRLMNIIRS